MAQIKIKFENNLGVTYTNKQNGLAMEKWKTK